MAIKVDQSVTANRRSPLYQNNNPAEVYTWAGQPRIVEVVKSERLLGGSSIKYAFTREIEPLLRQCIEAMKSEPWHQLNIDQRAAALAKYMAAIWQVHAFREGNTRTVECFCSQYMYSIGIPISRKVFAADSEQYRDMLVLACANAKTTGVQPQQWHLAIMVKYALEQGSVVLNRMQKPAQPKIYKDATLDAKKMAEVYDNRPIEADAREYAGHKIEQPQLSVMAPDGRLMPELPKALGKDITGQGTSAPRYSLDAIIKEATKEADKINAAAREAKDLLDQTYSIRQI